MTIRTLTIVLTVLLSTNISALSAQNAMVLGDGVIDGQRISPYSLSWQQCAVQEGEWVSSGALTEKLDIIGEQIVRHRQIGSQPGGVATVTSTYFDRASLAPLRIETEATRDGTQIAYVERNLNSGGYTGYMIRNGERTDLAGAPSSEMLHGMVLGLPLAAIDVQSEPLSFAASMVAFDGTYDVIATWAGSETIDWNEQTIDVQLIDVEWHHRESGDVYPPGPDESGGRFWVVNEPPAGFPYVPRYKTDTYAVEFLPQVCPND